MSNIERQFETAHTKADKVAQAFGDCAPRWVEGESLTQYRQRLLGKFKPHSAQWKSADLSKVTDDTAIDLIERQIYADAWNSAINPANIPEGQLVEVVETDRTGRRFSKFYGDPEAWLGQFKSPTKIVASWKR